MTRTKAFTPQRYFYLTRSGKDFHIVKGGSKYAKYYVIDPCSGDYLTRGAKTLIDAQIEAEGL